MATFNYTARQMTAKIVYYGPGLCGKTTNLRHVFEHTSESSRGKMVSLETQTDRTLFFDLLPINVGSIAGFKTRVQLYTVPGQVFYNSTRKLVLKGVDGVVFVADSQRAMMPSNVESLANLETNLGELDLSLDSIPVVLQYNKRDLPDICGVDEMSEALNRGGWPEFEASAVEGDGVFETLREISRLTLIDLKRQLGDRADMTPTPLKESATPPPEAATVVAEAPATPVPADANGHRTLDRSLALRLRDGDRERARKVSIDLQVRDADDRVLHQQRDIAFDLESPADLERLLLELQLSLDPER